jgi:hypothetical protein
MPLLNVILYSLKSKCVEAALFAVSKSERAIEPVGRIRAIRGLFD